MIESLMLKLLMMSGLNYAILMRVLLRLSLPLRIFIIGSTKLFSQKPGESVDDCFARFESIVSSLRSYDSLAYSDNECAKQLLYALDDSVWGMKNTVLEDSTDFAKLDTEKLLSKLKYHASRRWRPVLDQQSIIVVQQAHVIVESRRCMGIGLLFHPPFLLRWDH
jgi:hypothetical protein